MNTVDGNSQLCPLSGRRTTAELTVKLFIVHFTTLDALSHLLSIRGDYFYIAIAWYIIYPLGFIAQNILAMMFLLAYNMGYFLVKNHHPNWSETFIRPITWLLGRHEALRRVPTQEEDHNTETKSYWRVLGPYLRVLVVLCQCITSVYLYLRRQAYDPHATTLADDIVYRLAISGIFVTVLTLLIMLRIPSFKKGEIFELVTWLDRTMVSIGQRYSKLIDNTEMFDSEGWYDPLTFGIFFYSSTLATLGWIPLPWFLQIWQYKNLEGNFWYFLCLQPELDALFLF
jgi:hypothetical protein